MPVRFRWRVTTQATVWIGVLTLTGTALAAANPNTSQTTSTTQKTVVQGLLDRQHPTSAPYLSGFVVRTTWAAVEPAAGTFNFAGIDHALAYAASHHERVLLRVEAGTSSPVWVGRQTGSFTIYDQSGAALTLPRFWAPAFDAAYRGLSAALAARYDTNPTVGGFESDECQMVYPEPYLRDDWNPQNAKNLVGAGFTLGADAACHLAEMHAGLDYWRQVPTRIAFNPYQAVQPDGTVKQQETVTADDMRAFRQLGGPLAVLGNDSISSTRMTVPAYGQMYALQKQLGAPITYQTATAARIGDWQVTLAWAVNQGANAVELPAGYTGWDAATLGKYNSELLANPTGSGGPSPSPSPSPTQTSPSPSPSPTQTSPAPSSGPISKVLVVVEENHSRAAALAGMPYLASLATTYGQATGYMAVSHPSLPNYLSIAAGSDFGITNDYPPSSHPIHGPSVFDQAITAGRTARTYAESMTSNCQQTAVGDYGVKHNPWAYMVDPTERADCLAGDVPFTAFAGDVSAGNLPSLGVVIPNLIDDAHNGTLAQADAWLRSLMATVQAGPDWQAGRLAVIVTFDEGSSGSQNVAFVVADPHLHGVTVTSAFPQGHYSLSRDLSGFVGATPLNNAGNATEGLFQAFGF